MTSSPFAAPAPAHAPAPGRRLHLAWAAFQRRQVSMADLAGFDCWFMPMPYKGRSHLVRGVHYLALAWRTLRLLQHTRPPELWLQLPQLPLLWVALLYRLLFDRNVVLVADCHNAVFVPPWSRMPLVRASLAACDAVLVHNHHVLVQALAMGLPRHRVCVLEDVPPCAAAEPAEDPAPAVFAGRPHPWVLCAGSYGRDEPVAQVLHAATLLAPEGTVAVTGRIGNAARNGHDITHTPPNVVLTDYVPVPAFEALLRHCDVVLALTRCDGIQLSACNEALGFGKPMVMSDTPLLRQLFGSAAVAVDSEDPHAIAAGIGLAWRDAVGWAQRSRRAAQARRLAWQHGPLQECLALIRRTAPRAALQVQP